MQAIGRDQDALHGIRIASIGPVTSNSSREQGLRALIETGS